MERETEICSSPVVAHSFINKKKKVFFVMLVVVCNFKGLPVGTWWGTNGIHGLHASLLQQQRAEPIPHSLHESSH